MVISRMIQKAELKSQYKLVESFAFLTTSDIGMQKMLIGLLENGLNPFGLIVYNVKNLRFRREI